MRDAGRYFLDDAGSVLSASRFPVVVVEVRSDRIVAASPSASSLLDPSLPSVVDRAFESFTADAHLDTREVFRSGRITGFEAVRMLVGPSGSSPVRTWVHQLDHGSTGEFVLIVLTPIIGNMPSTTGSENLDDTLRRVTRGMTVAPVRQPIGGAGLDLPGLAGLTPRQREVLSLLVAGMRVPAIARTLFLSHSTVRTHVAALEHRLGVSTQQQVIDLFLSADRERRRAEQDGM